jgi:hypothetical protein
MVTVISVCRPVSISGCHLAGPVRRKGVDFREQHLERAAVAQVWKKTCGLRVEGRFPSLSTPAPA